MQVSARFHRNWAQRAGGQTVRHWVLRRGRSFLEAPYISARISTLVDNEGRKRAPDAAGMGDV